MILTALMVIFLYVKGRFCNPASWFTYSKDDWFRPHFSKFHPSWCRRWEQTFLHSPPIPDAFEKLLVLAYGCSQRGYKTSSRYTHTLEAMCMFPGSNNSSPWNGFWVPFVHLPALKVFQRLCFFSAFFLFLQYLLDFLTNFFFSSALPTLRDFTSSD